MEKISTEQAIVNQMASNFATKIAELEVEKAILQVDNQLLKQQLEKEGEK
ncbi:hypothetical protein [Enterococcus wangshanyuanii]|uniref:Transposase n=1 Tax=Enterococcus wangshanyuanii TaxID=2005703 RepID=A0ABQ1P2Q4_9ENTE|nr:hypothetical protein [Enterococcus wangshanyuanii]GGC87773.1 hypothetical protein GCM10011573_16730 [Enterococcus wangshanyuanii]